jgi:hypothetical protein
MRLGYWKLLLENVFKVVKNLDSKTIKTIYVFTIIDCKLLTRVRARM